MANYNEGYVLTVTSLVDSTQLVKEGRLTTKDGILSGIDLSSFPDGDIEFSIVLSPSGKTSSFVTNKNTDFAIVSTSLFSDVSSRSISEIQAASETETTSPEYSFSWYNAPKTYEVQDLVEDFNQNYPGVVAFYSLREVTEPAVNVVRVRRSSDNLERDFLAKELVDGTLDSFVGNGTGYVKIWYDQAGDGNDALETATNRQPIIFKNGSIVFDSQYQSIESDGTSVSLTCNLPTSSGATMLIGSSLGSDFFEANLGSGFQLKPTFSRYPSYETLRVFWNRPLSEAEKQEIRTKINYINWSFSGTTDFEAYWGGDNRLTSFPLIDTSSATIFKRTWLNCNSLTSFPLIDTSNVTILDTTWQRCSSLTSFPLIDTSNVTTLIGTWLACTSLTSFPLINTSNVTIFNGTWVECTSLTSFPLIDTSSATTLSGAWRSCFSLTSFPEINTSNVTSLDSTWAFCSSLTSFPLINTSNVTNFAAAWRNCSLTSFPEIDTSSGSDFSVAWSDCTSLTSFPLINTSNATSLRFAWNNCSSLTSFPSIDTSNVTDFSVAWSRCSSLTSFPEIDTSSGTNFVNAWFSCVSLVDFPANVFDSTPATDFANAFLNTNLSQQSIDNILVSINTAGTSNGTFDQSGGSAPSSAGQAAIDSLRSRGWTVSVTGGY